MSSPDLYCFCTFCNVFHNFGLPFKQMHPWHCVHYNCSAKKNCGDSLGSRREGTLLMFQNVKSLFKSSVSKLWPFRNIRGENDYNFGALKLWLFRIRIQDVGTHFVVIIIFSRILLYLCVPRGWGEAGCVCGEFGVRARVHLWYRMFYLQLQRVHVWYSLVSLQLRWVHVWNRMFC